MQANISLPTTQQFILPRQSQHIPSALLACIYAENYLDEVAPNKCRCCKVQRLRRTCAKAMSSIGNPCSIAFDYCPQCLRIKPTTERQLKRVVLVTSIKPLSAEYVFIQSKFQQARNEGRRVINKSEYDAWLLEFNEAVG